MPEGNADRDAGQIDEAGAVHPDGATAAPANTITLPSMRPAPTLSDDAAAAIDAAFAAAVEPLAAPRAVEPPVPPPVAAEPLSSQEPPSPSPPSVLLKGDLLGPNGAAELQPPSVAASPGAEPIGSVAEPELPTGLQGEAAEHRPPDTRPPDPARTPLGEILVLYVAALIALGAFGLAVYLEMQDRRRDEIIAREIASLRAMVETLEARDPTVTNTTSSAPEVRPFDFPTNDGTIDAILALQKRLLTLEDAANAPVAAPAAAGKTVLLDGPTEDCIPIETRFVALPGEDYPVCRTTEVINLANITSDSVTTKAGANIVEGGFTRLDFGSCTLLVLAADVEGFAELRVTCS